jgi:peptidoglycan-associated lipoprotein
MGYFTLSGRSNALMISASAVLLFTAACSHKSVAVKSPAPPANQTDQTTSTPAPQRTFANNSNSNTRPAPVAANNGTMTPAERKNLNESLARMEDALFDYDTASIRPDAMKALQEDVTVIRTTLAKYPSEVVKIEGHCDERGSAEYNLALGDRRAAAAKEFLTKLGISSAQLSPVSYGKEHQVCSDHTEACWQANRRAHLVAENNPPAATR